MNRVEIVNEIATLEKKIEVMEKDLKTFAIELSATSQVAIIAKMVYLQAQIEEYEKMIDLLDFQEITKDLDMN